MFSDKHGAYNKQECTAQSWARQVSKIWTRRYFSGVISLSSIPEPCGYQCNMPLHNSKVYVNRAWILWKPSCFPHYYKMILRYFERISIKLKVAKFILKVLFCITLQSSSIIRI